MIGVFLNLHEEEETQIGLLRFFFFRTLDIQTMIIIEIELFFLLQESMNVIGLHVKMVEIAAMSTTDISVTVRKHTRGRYVMKVRLLYLYICIGESHLICCPSSVETETLLVEQKSHLFISVTMATTNCADISISFL